MILTIFGWIGSAGVVFSLLQSRMTRLRVINLVASVALILYNALIASWPMVGMNAAIVLIDVYQLFKQRTSATVARKPGREVARSDNA